MNKSMKIGIDCIEILRLKRMCIVNPKLINFIFSECELSINNKNEKYKHYAGVFAAKEAIMKALNPLIPLQDIKKIIIQYEDTGKPYVKLSTKYIKSKKIQVSISHSGNIAMAVCIVED